VTFRLTGAGAAAGAAGLILGIAAVSIWWRFDSDIERASARDDRYGTYASAQ
jgi:hypothetical protein